MIDNLLFISDVRSLLPGARFITVATIRKFEAQSSPAAGRMLRLDAADRSGALNAVIFNSHPKFAAFDAKAPSGLVFIRGTADIYRGAFSPKIDDITPAPSEAEYIERVQRTSERPVDEMKNELASLLCLLSSDVRAAVEDVLASVSPEYYSHPAAIAVHHNHRHGLIEHTLSSIQVARFLCQKYSSLSPREGIVIASLIIHDCGKVKEYDSGTTTSFATAGLLQDHISFAHAQWTAAAIRHKVPDDIAQHIGHCVLAHHGERQRGSPVEPHTIEAWIVHLADYTDSRFGILASALADDSTSPVVQSKYAGPIVRASASI